MVKIDAQVHLTPREQQILTLLCDGKGMTLVAAELGWSVSSVKRYCSVLYHKLSVHSRHEAVAVALRTGLVPLDNGN